MTFIRLPQIARALRGLILLLLFFAQIQTIAYCQSAKFDNITDSLEKLVPTLPSDTSRVKTLSLLFNQYRGSDFLKAIEIAEKELALSKEIKFAFGEANAYRHLGVSYYAIGDKHQAVAFYIQAIKRYEKLNERYFVAACHNNIGLVYMDEHHYSEASNYFNKAFSIWNTLKDGQEGMAIVMNNLADLYALQGNAAESLEYNLRALKIAKQIDGNVGSIWLSLAEMYMKNNEHLPARKYLDSALAIGRIKNDKELQLKVQLTIGKLNLNRKQDQSASAAAYQAKMLSEQTGDKTGLIQAIALLADIHASTGDFSKAFTLQRKCSDMQDSLYKKNNSIRMGQLIYAHELERKNLQSQVLLNDKKLREAQIAIYQVTIERQYALVALIGIALFAFVLLAIFYFRSYTRKRRSMYLLELKNQEIELQNEEIRSGNEQIKEQQESMARLNAEQTKLFSIIAHDLRHPLSNVKSIVTLFRNQLLTGKETAQLLDRLLNALNHTSEFLENLLFWAKSQMQGAEIVKSKFDLSATIRKNINLLREQASAKQIVLQNNVTQRYEAFADEQMISVVISNLLSNAIKFSKQKDTVSISASLQANGIAVYIEDTGIGMSEETVKKIMCNQEFYTTPGTNDEKGTGIGINLCIEFLKKNEGWLDVKSEPNKGSVFILTVPNAIA